MNAVKQRMLSSQAMFVSVFFKLSAMLSVFLFPFAVYSACGDDWIARVVSVQGVVDVREKNQATWQSVELQKVYCRGDTIRVKENSRAALELHNDTILRLNQNSTLILSGPKKDSSWVDLITGTLHSISRVPRALKVGTPFVNADVEGTEFLVEVGSDNTLVGVIEGKVAVSNEHGRIVLTKNQSAVSYQGKGPVLRLDIKPVDSVQWSLYYPRLNVEDLKQAEDLLQVGQVDAAEAALQGKTSAEVLSLRSIIAIAKNEKDKALDFSAQAIAQDAHSVAAHLARSYAMQARFDLKAAKRSAQKAVELQPEHALAWARLAELYLSTGDLQPGLDAAKRASELEPDLARTQTILGFAYLIQFEVDRAKQTFERSLTLDSADPLARLGQGLAEIRDGHLQQGRRYIEIAASLDPNNALIRSYLGKAYYEENRSKVAGDQLQLAKELDPADPTAWYYDAIRLQSDNQPVDAMLDLQESIKLNDNRAVYRSRQLLDQDAAARSASVARIYSSLGFAQLALQDGVKSVDADPSNHSAHRFLADSYALLPRHENARRSELLQSQLLQPLNANPIQPQLAESNLGVLSGAGPAGRASSDFNPLFTRDGINFQMNTIVGSQGTLGEDLTFSGIHKNIAYSIGQHHFETDGFRVNNDLRQDNYNAFMQFALTNNISIQAEYQNRSQVNGALIAETGYENFSPVERYKHSTESGRLGLHHRLSNDYDLLMSFIYRDYKKRRFEPIFKQITDPFQATSEGFSQLVRDTESHLSELQLIRKGGRFSYIAGMGSYDEDDKFATHFRELITAPIIFPTPFLNESIKAEEVNASYWNAYLYSQLVLSKELTLTIGAAYDKLSSTFYDNRGVNPKLGLKWSSPTGSTVRMAYIESVGRPASVVRTLEPTQVAGFNQFFDDTDGSKIKSYGAAFEQQFTSSAFAGIELRKREHRSPINVIGPLGGLVVDRDETIHRAYAYWTPTKQLALSAEYYVEEEGGRSFSSLELKSRRLPLGVRYFWKGGNFVSLTGTYIDQDYKDAVADSQDSYWVFDAGVGFRLPKRQGSFQIVVKNLLDNDFNYYDVGLNGLTRGTRNPVYSPDRQILAQFSFVIQ